MFKLVFFWGGWGRGRGHAFESAKILGNSFCYCGSEKTRNKSIFHKKMKEW
jgi:hypothetical protein